MGKGIVVVTGASTGIGEAAALHMSRLGFRVFAGVRKPADGEALRAKSAGAVEPLLLDVTDAGSIASMATEVARSADVTGTGVAGLVNNAGIAVGGPLEFLPVSALRHQFEVNVIGLMAVTQAFLPLIRRVRGRIINMGSMSGRITAPFLGPYSASKFALEALTASLRMELKPSGIHVALVGPGAISTPIWAKSTSASAGLFDNAPPEAEALYGPVMTRLRNSKYGRPHGLPPEDVARVVEHALTAPRPKTRYAVGADARGAEWLRLVPDSLREALIRRHMNL